MRDVRLPLTILTAVLVLVGASTAVLLFDSRVTSADALRTGGLAAGSVVALYALWLNDRRRKVEEHRQELDTRRQELDSERYALEQRRQDLEDRRTQHDRDRAADERFGRALELLGHEADQVRIGAMHALAGLARAHPDHTQTVLDVLCGYLRRPFDHPKWTRSNTAPADELPEATPEQDRERTVRQTAARLLRDLLPTTAETDPPIHRLDLSHAKLELFDLSDRVVGRIAMYAARFRHTVHFSRTEFRGPVRFSDAVFVDKVRFTGAVFTHVVKAENVQWWRAVTFASARFERAVDFRSMRSFDSVSFADAELADGVDLRHSRFHARLDLRMREPLPVLSLRDTEVCAPGDAQLPAGLRLLPAAGRGRTYLWAEDAVESSDDVR